MKIRLPERNCSYPDDDEAKLRALEGKDVTLKDLADLNIGISIVPMSYDAATDSVEIDHPMVTNTHQQQKGRTSMFQLLFGNQEFQAFLEEKYGAEYEAWKLKATDAGDSSTNPFAPAADLDAACELAMARVQEQVSRSYQKWKLRPCSYGAFSRNHVPDIIQTREFADSWERITGQVIHIATLHEGSSSALNGALFKLPQGESYDSRFDFQTEVHREMEARDEAMRQRIKDEVLNTIARWTVVALVVVIVHYATR